MDIVGNTHLIAGTEATIARLLAYLEVEGIGTDANPDLYVRSYTQFGIDEARELRDRAALSAAGDRRIFVVQAPTLTTEAQNALLKTLEEPPGGALFFIIVAAPDTLLGTLRSRAQMLLIEGEQPESPIDPRAFLSASPAKRLDMLKPLLDKGDDDRRDLSAIVTFLSSLEGILGTAGSRDGLEPARREGIESVYRAKKYLGDKGALVKPLLEQLALLTPVLS